MKRSVAILVFEGAEVLDFSGPFEVFSVASELHGHCLFDVDLVAGSTALVHSVNGMRVAPGKVYAEIEAPDILVLSGGAGSRQAMHDAELLAWVSRAAGSAEIVLSICSGSRILAALGLLAGQPFATHHEVFEHLLQIEPTAVPRPGVRFVDTGRIITTGGISAGIDGAFHVVARLLGRAVAERTAAYMEYAWTPDRDYPAA